MSSEAIVVLVIIAFAVVGLFYLERNSRKNRSDNEFLSSKIHHGDTERKRRTEECSDQVAIND